MLIRSLLVLAALVPISSSAGVPALPRVQAVPVFWQGQRSPAFLVQCVNDSQSSRPLIEHLLQNNSIRLDGTLHERQGVVGSILGGRWDVAPGEVFMQVVVLGDSPQEPFTIPNLKARYVVAPWAIRPTPGEHLISFKCWAEWTPDVRFIWALS